MLRLLTLDAQGERKLKSGILTDVKVTADPRANALIVSAPAESMELLAALIKQLDQLPTAEAQLKVFTIVNGDASNLAEMLRTLFGRAQTPGQGGGGGGANAVLGGVAQGENSLVPLRFSVDQRTNSIVVSGSAGDLNVVEAILLRLDDSDVRQRKSVVYRLKNAPALDVATAVNEFLRSQRQVQQISPGLLSPFEQIEREVIVVPEPVSNSLIVSATPRYFDEIRRVVEELDARPPMVMIQVLIAEIALNNVDEFGVELGLQDSVLFDRSLLGNLVQNTTTTTFGNPPTTVQQQQILGATNAPGFDFNNQPLGNSGSDKSLGTRNNVGAQGLSNFSVGRINNELGFGGLVLSASSENVSILLRALQECRRLDVLSRPQVMTLDNQPAFVQVGQRVPFITAVQIGTTGQQSNTVAFENVGLILGVTPRISPDGLVVMEIDATRSEVGPEAEGIPVSVSASGAVVRSPRINITTAQTTVSALSGQTVVLGGLIVSNKRQTHRRVPLLSDIPMLGNLFRYDNVTNSRSELLIIMTPRVVRSEQDAELIKQVEAARMTWCLADVIRMHGESGLRSRRDEWLNDETPTVYPDLDPSGNFMHIKPEEIPTPAQPQSVLPGPVVPGPILQQPIENQPTPAQPQPKYLPDRKQGRRPTSQPVERAGGPVAGGNNVERAVYQPSAPKGLQRLPDVGAAR
jgi:type II secretion system protein D